MFRNSDAALMYAATPIFLKNNRIGSNMTQYGLKPTSPYDFICPTNLINFGRSSGMDTLGTRIGNTSSSDSSPSINSYAVINQAAMLGVAAKTKGGESLSFCSGETAALKVCMSKGTSSCEQESAVLDSCLKRVSKVKGAISRAGREYTDWLTQQVSDNYMTPFMHRPQDWRHAKQQEILGRTKSQSFQTGERRPKQMAAFKKYYTPIGRARNSRLPFNK
eukprot:Tbor_TRINITY_DN5311_c1_g1::TRINITY_DN5311_c1_g1_i1::g.5237::m.5237